MSGTVKSLSTKIGLDNTEFLKGMKQVDKSIKATDKTAKELQKGLEFEFDDKRFVQAQKQAQAALSITEEKAEAIRKQLKYLEESGGVNTEGYEKLQAELAKTETKALELKKRLDDINQLKLDQLSNQFKEFGDKAENAGKKMLGISAAAGVAVGGMYKLAQNARTTADDIATNAVKYDLATDSIQKWSYIAQQSDVPAEALFKAATKIRAAFGDQMTGTMTTATKALNALGLDMQKFGGDNEAAFEGTILALSQIQDKTLQAAYANDIFGERFAANVIPLLQTGQDAIASYIGEFEQVGYLSEKQVNKLAELDNELNMVNSRFEQAKLELGVALVPILEITADLMENTVTPAVKGLAAWFGNLDEGTQKNIIGIMALVAVLAPLLIVVGKVSTGIGALIKIVQSLTKATALSTAGFIALGGALAIGIDLIANWQQMSTVEKVLKSLAVGALAAAAAFTVFHASASVGIAVGAITAGVAAGLAVINAAKKKILPDEPDIAADIDTGFKSNTGYNFDASKYAGNAGNVVTDNSTTEINITMQATGDLDYDAESLADEVNRILVDRKLAYGGTSR